MIRRILRTGVIVAFVALLAAGIGARAAETPPSIGHFPYGTTGKLLMKPLPLEAIVPQSADMTGWTQLTNGAAHSGASVVIPVGLGQVNPHQLVLVRGADDGLYVAPILIDAMPASPLQGTQWQQVATGIRGQPQCVPYYSMSELLNSITATVGRTVGSAVHCIALGAGHTIVDARFDEDAFLKTVTTLPGVTPGSRPTILTELHDEQAIFADAPQTTLSTFGMWNGVAGLMIAQQNVSVSPFEAYPKVNPSQIAHNVQALPVVWQLSKTLMFSPINCENGMCTWLNAQKIVTLKQAADVAAKAGFLGQWFPFTTLGAPPGGAAGTPEGINVTGGSNGQALIVTAAVVVRGANGHLFATFAPANGVWSNHWIDEGGYVHHGATPSCVQNTAGVLCVIQGADGRLWYRNLSLPTGGASGL
jgi:hypothetical protein